jgi:hypothetical protein
MHTSKIQNEMHEQLLLNVVVALIDLRGLEFVEPRVVKIQELLLDHLQIYLKCQAEIVKMVNFGLVGGCCWGPWQVIPPMLTLAFAVLEILDGAIQRRFQLTS